MALFGVIHLMLFFNGQAPSSQLSPLVLGRVPKLGACNRLIKSALASQVHPQSTAPGNKMPASLELTLFCRRFLILVPRPFSDFLPPDHWIFSMFKISPHIAGIAGAVVRITPLIWRRLTTCDTSFDPKINVLSSELYPMIIKIIKPPI